MSTEFKDITIIAKPDPKKVKEKGYRYTFPFPCSSNPPKEWEEMFKMEWQAKITEWSKKQNDLKSDLPILPWETLPTPYTPPSVNIEGLFIELECGIDELSPLSEYLVASINATNQRYNETLEERDEEQRRIREAVDAIKLP